MDKCMRARVAKHFTWIMGCLAMLGIAWLLLPGEAPAPEPLTPPSASGALDGHVIAVDAGHGGYDGGARAPNGGQWEKVYNLQIALKLRDALAAQGAQVILTRDGDYALCDPNPPMRKKRQDMERRAAVILDNQAELLISVHMNEYRDQSQRGPQVFYRKDCPAGLSLAQLLQASLNTALTPPRARQANTGDFYILSLGIPSVLVECGFLSNPAEEALLRDDAYQQRIADVLCEGVIAWYAQDSRPAASAREER